jgi:hypothetical protein
MHTAAPEDLAIRKTLDLIGTKYTLGWCILCKTLRLLHVDCPGMGTTCNGGGCDDCTEDFDNFVNALTWNWKNRE